ncbi:acylphosphatase [Rhizobium mesoamericanum]|uniref:acylphosphatase n=1 Tax=Rhizobium mesoamericanum TaxID=1079800 RepID=UPI00278A3CC8|nr:acylphosphatase [Rhizobium mesoamericanum]MDQ0559861.1 acylphosphatase [Rhizobium mesoamericanum]
MPEQHLSLPQETMTIIGELDAASFVPWIQRHAAKLGLSHAVSHASADRIELQIAGPPELIDMMEMGCSLGPIEVWVETILRRPIMDDAKQR